MITSEQYELNVELGMYSVLNGSKTIRNIFDPKPEEIDIPSIEPRAARMYRFSFHERALSILQHSRITELIANFYFGDPVTSQWAKMHDFHEVIMGCDIIRPFKAALDTDTSVHRDIAENLDRAICGAAGIDYPMERTIKDVKLCDDMALFFEQKYVLGVTPTNHMGIPEKLLAILISYCEVDLGIETVKEIK